jgi:C4-dicarboxylate-specific signal transduction histidine kinase
MHFEDEVRRQLAAEANTKEVLSLANAIRAVYMACTTGLGEVHRPDQQRVDLIQLEEQVRVLLNADFFGAVVVHPFRFHSPEIVVCASPVMLTYVTYALVNNALKACASNNESSEPGDVQVAWQVRNNHVELSVIDNGGGLNGATWEEMSRETYSVWPDRKEDEKKTKSQSHLGMGLYIVKRLIEDCALGTVTAETVVSTGGRKGAAFRVRVPSAVVAQPK